MTRRALGLDVLILGLVPAVLGLAGCGATLRNIAKIDVAVRSPSEKVPRELQVGTARVDVTPPPGPSTFGHGPDALASQGFWTRLECRVFAVVAGGERFAIVPCDLPAISYSLFREVVAASHIAPDHLLMTATHTHAGPAHYFEPPAYSGVLSTRRPGYDDVMLQFLSARIAKGIERAFAAPQKAELRWRSLDMWGFTRNRNVDAYDLNGRSFPKSCAGSHCELEQPPCDPGSAWVPSAVPDRSALDSGPCRHLGRACELIDPSVDVLEIRRATSSSDPADRKPLIGQVVFLAMHPTILPAHTRLFGADVFGIISRELEHDMRLEWSAAGERDPDPLAALINTNEGDMVPAWSAADIDETRHFGAEVARKIWETSASDAGGSRAPDPGGVPVVGRFEKAMVFASRAFEVDMAAAASTLNVNQRRPAMLGQGSSHGSSDHRATVDDITDRLPDWRLGAGSHVPKAPLLAGLQKALVSPDGFPSQVPFALFRIGDRWIGAVPAEVTITAGSRIRAAIERGSGAGARGRYIVAGLAGAYIQYVTTCEEYQLQRYEGASNLYGARTESFISNIEQTLACRLSDTPGPSCSGAALSPGVREQFGAFEIAPDADRTGRRFPLPEGPSEPLVQGVCKLPRGGDAPTFCFRWLDASPGDLDLAKKEAPLAPWFALRTGGPGTEVRWDPADARSFVDDFGDAFAIRARTRCSDDRFSYTALFLPTARVWAGISKPDAALRVALTKGVFESHAKTTFEFHTKTTRDCSREETLFCTDENEPATDIPEIACHR
ncbi:MAG TPA: neutral/alkaline non-lysosomal ceramidase N-terminal domain-containing protein [Polyangiaceae bacterium]|nr:neutral/alkaline non-lysosomal ceramidase N-terminal domain-containing protein [Polyangiaceae bacterium]